MQVRLLEPSAGMLAVSEHWYQALDGNPEARALFARHYSKYVYADGRDPKLFVGPGAYICLIDEQCSAMFVWRQFISQDKTQDGINCSIFRNESTVRASLLIIEAMAVAWRRWPGARFYTYVNPRKVKTKGRPGWCFIKAGWRFVGITKKRKYLIFAFDPSVQ